MRLNAAIKLIKIGFIGLVKALNFLKGGFMDWIKLLPGMDVAYTRKANAITRLDDEIRELEDALKAVMEKKDKLEKELIADIKTSFTNEEIMKAIADSEIYLYK